MFHIKLTIPPRTFTSILFLLTFILASFLRFYRLGATPISLNWDEAALGYNAYSLLKTGSDEYGNFFPFILRSFGNYTPALYAYLAIPAIALFDLNQFSVRLPAAIMGVLAVIGSFFLTKQLCSLDNNTKKHAHLFALLVMVLLAISPWHLQFSRVAYEAGVALTCILWGFYFFLRAIKKPYLFLLSAFCFGLTFHAYHSTRFLTPLFLFILIIVFFKDIRQHSHHLIRSFFLLLFFLLPFVWLMVTGNFYQITARFQATNNFQEILENNSFNKTKSYTAVIFHSPIITTSEKIIQGYLSHFSLLWLFITGDNDRHHAPSTGLLYIWELPFLLLGLVSSFQLQKKLTLLLWGWLILIPFPAALTTEVPHAVRTLVWLPLPYLFIALGLSKFIKSIPKHLISIIVCLICGIGIVGYSLGEYFYQYHSIMNLTTSRFWQFGYEHAVNFAKINKAKYDKIVVSQDLEQPYIFFLFYKKYDPVEYLRQGGTKGYATQQFDSYEFTKIDWDRFKNQNILYLITPYEAATKPITKIIHTIRYFDGSDAMIFAE